MGRFTRFGALPRGMASAQTLAFASLVLLALCLYSTVAAQSVTTSTPSQTVDEGANVDFVCTYNFANPDVKWKFTDKEGSQILVFFDKKFTDAYKDRATPSGTGIRLLKVTRKDTGKYACDVTDGTQGVFGEANMELIVKVLPSPPVMAVPTSVTTGGVAVLQCSETDGSPPSTYNWYKDKTLMPEKPQSIPKFQNSSYTLNPATGELRFDPVTKDDIGEYHCEAVNGIGKAVSTPVVMSVHDTNVGGIVAAVIIVLIILALIGVGIWFAYSRGYIGKKSSTGKKVIYSTPSENKNDRNFQQTSSFLV